MTKKKEEILDPKIIDNTKKFKDLDRKELLNIAEEIKESTIETSFGNDNADSFFREVVNKLMSKKDISLKTDYLNVNENFAGSKIDFIGRNGNMPILNDWLETWEIKRTSLERKSRKEIIMALEKREEELKNRQQNALRNMFGI